MAQDDSTLTNLEKEIIKNYNSLLAEKVTGDLLANYKNYKETPNTYWSFINDTFLINWDFDATTRALIGNEIFSSLSGSEFTELSKTIKVTLIRYAFESLSFYREQKLTVIDVKINQQQTFAWLKINMNSIKFPDIHLDLLLKRTDKIYWKGTDFRFKGITYVNLKKHGYRQDFKHLKFKGFLRKLEEKNKVFFQSLCQHKVNYTDPDKPPCLYNDDKEKPLI